MLKACLRSAGCYPARAFPRARPAGPIRSVSLRDGWNVTTRRSDTGIRSPLLRLRAQRLAAPRLKAPEALELTVSPDSSAARTSSKTAFTISRHSVCETDVGEEQVLQLFLGEGRAQDASSWEADSTLGCGAPVGGPACRSNAAHHGFPRGRLLCGEEGADYALLARTGCNRHAPQARGSGFQRRRGGAPRQPSEKALELSIAHCSKCGAAESARSSSAERLFSTTISTRRGPCEGA